MYDPFNNPMGQPVQDNDDDDASDNDDENDNDGDGINDDNDADRDDEVCWVFLNIINLLFRILLTEHVVEPGW